MFVKISDGRLRLARIVNTFHKQTYEYMFNEHQFQAQCYMTFSSRSAASFACNAHVKGDAAYMHCRSILPHGL